MSGIEFTAPYDIHILLMICLFVGTLSLTEEKCLAQGHNTMPLVRLEQSQAEHTTTEPLRSSVNIFGISVLCL